MTSRLHHDGRFRRWLAASLGRDESEGDRLWRRSMHLGGALVLLYYPVPSAWLGPVPKEALLLGALGAVVALEVARLVGHVELPTIRGYEARRPASYLYYAVGLVLAVLVFPEGIAVAVVLGVAFVDPLAGELRSQVRWARLAPALPLAVYAALAVGALREVGPWPWPAAVGLGVVASGVAVGVERLRHAWLDDDLTMTVAPALFLYVTGVLALGLPT